MRTMSDVEIEHLVGQRTPFKTTVSLFNGEYLRRVLDIFDGDEGQTAKALGLDQHDLRKKMKKYDVHRTITFGNGSTGKSRNKRIILRKT